MKLLDKKDLFTGIGLVTGVLTTSVLSYKAGKKIEELDYRKNTKSKETKVEKIKAITPPIVVGLATSIGIFALIINNNRKLEKSLNGVLSSYIMLNEEYGRYKKLVEDEIGEEKNNELLVKSKQRRNSLAHITDNKEADSEMIFYEPLTNKFYEAYERDIIDAEYHLNRNFVLRGYAYLNEWLEFLGNENIRKDIPSVKLSDLSVEDKKLFGYYFRNEWDGARDTWDISEEYYWIDFAHIPINIKGIGEVIMIYPDFTPKDDHDIPF